MRRKPRPAKPDTRPAWMIEQGARCGCRGTDDMCPCQNETPWPRPAVDWQARALASEAREAALREKLEGIVKAVEEAGSEISRSPGPLYSAGFSAGARSVKNWVRQLLKDNPDG